MKKALLLMALFAGSLLSANAADFLTAYVKPGDVGQLAIRLTNPDAQYTAFQVTVNLPEGLSFPTDAAPVLSARKASTHQVYFNKVDAKTMKIAVFSAGEGDKPTTGNENFSQAKGELLTINVTPAAGFFTDPSKKVEEGTVKLLDNIEFVSGVTGAVLQVEDKGKSGDANGDNTLDTSDAILVINHFLGLGTLEPVQVERSSMTGNNSVDTSDAILIINEYLGL